MARKPTPLTNTQIKQAKPRDKEYNLADGDGLALRIRPNGSKMWVFNYTRPHTTKRANLSFGLYPEVTLADARIKRLDARKLLAEGIDPKQEKDKEAAEKVRRNASTLEAVTRQWFDLKKGKITGDYAEDIIRSLDNHIFPKLGRLPLADVTAPQVIATLKPLSNVGKLEMVKRICSRLNQVMTYATNTGLVASNPLAGIRHAFETPEVTNNPTLRPEQLPELLTAIEGASIRQITRHLLVWQLHTMTRPGEAAGARWVEIDQDNRLWIIPAERMKKRREHVIPLTKEALALLEQIRAISGRGEFLFPSDIHPQRCANSSTANVALKRMGFKGRLTAHGMRSIASTALNEQGFEADIVEVALAHIDKNQTRATYNRAQYLERRRVMMDWWSAQIEQAATGNMNLTAGIKALRAVN